MGNDYNRVFVTNIKYEKLICKKDSFLKVSFHGNQSVQMLAFYQYKKIPLLWYL
ncbi:hypothetical protein J2W57_001613 [Chryseobacterium ginsenosidimutans]|jgi:hypothetical protein|uniref:Uncharacterized protein n=1 Tax=Chryseobacterium geocarposphaerae TaxID=1416776 RepID=A0ABU1LCS2_9FLAO|nr:hypothetical protein [Chryseobacterium geocarposphaerae]MDR6698245.1 hypothetical protein [Chryseobacterium ginsenosidimutans]